MKYILNDDNIIIGLDVSKDIGTILPLDVVYGVDQLDNGKLVRLYVEPDNTEIILKSKRINEIQAQLNALSQDIVQDMAGEIVPNINERKLEFITLHNELRVLEGKEPRAVVVGE